MNDTTKQRLEDSVFLVEATSAEQHLLWKDYSPESDWSWHALESWTQVNTGYGFEIGRLADMPVFITLSWAKINNQLVTFYEATSQVVDYRMVEKWLHENFTKTYGGGRWAHTNATNFHHCLQGIKEANAK